MSYSYESHKPVREQSKAEPEKTADAGRSYIPTSGASLPPAAPGTGASPGLEAVMQERMARTFGDLNAVREAAIRPAAFSVTPDAAPVGLYTGPVTHALSGASPSPAAAGPMQAKRGGSKKSKPKPKKVSKTKKAPEPAPEPYGPNTGPLKTDEASILAAQKKTYQTEKGELDPFANFLEDSFADNRVNPTPREGMEGLSSRLLKKYSGPAYKEGAYTMNISRPKSADEENDVVISGWDITRILPSLAGDRGRSFNMSEKDIEAMADKIMAPHKKGMSQKEQEQANILFDKGIMQYKGILNDDLEHMENTYGALLTQMHPQDVVPQLGKEYHKKYHFIQDALQIVANGKYMNYDKEKDRRFRDLSKYYNDAGNQLSSYAPYATNNQWVSLAGSMHPDSAAPVNKDLESSLKGPKMSKNQEKDYKKRMKSRAKKGGWKDRLFGRYK